MTKYQLFGNYKYVFSLDTKYVCAPLVGQRNRNNSEIIVTLSLLLKQVEDVALPEVPTEPLPEVPEAAKAEPGTANFLISHHGAFLYTLVVN